MMLMLNRALQKKQIEEHGREAIEKTTALTLKRGKHATTPNHAMKSTKPLHDAAGKTMPKSNTGSTKSCMKK